MHFKLLFTNAMSVISIIGVSNSTIADCRLKRVDVALLIDTSDSAYQTGIAQDIMIRTFAKGVINHTSSDDTHFALTYFWDSAQNVFLLGELPAKVDMFNMIDITYIPHGGSFAGLGLVHVSDTVFSGAMGDRLDADNIVVLVTDGYVSDPDVLLQKANEMKANGVHFIVVAIGNANMTLLTQIASSPAQNNLFSVLSIDALVALNTVIDEQLADVCEGNKIRRFLFYYELANKKL